MISINLHPEYVMSVAGIEITNTFLTSVIVTILLALMSILFYIRRNDHKNIFINAIRIVVFELLKLTDSVTHDRKLSKKILPLIVTFFIYIVSSNLLALLPGFLGSFFITTPEGKIPILRSPTSELTTTLALAIFSVVAIQYFSVKALGVKKYLQKFFNFSGPIQLVLGFFELISEVVKILSFSFRLFGNIFAGEVLLIVIAFLVPFIIPLPFMFLEVFVSVVQAFIFAILTLVFIKTSTIQHQQLG